MRKDEEWKNYFYDNARYADLINGAAFAGRQVLTADSLQELDTQTGFVREPDSTGRDQKAGRRKKNQKGGIRYRDMLRKAAFGAGCAVIGIEPEERADYSMPLRDMYYSVGEYEKQASQVRSRVRAGHRGLKGGEYLYRFPRGTLLNPVVTVILYCGEEEWDGPRTLHEMLDLSGIPEELAGMVPDYRINILEVRRMEDTGVFQTDLRQVLDFIRLSGSRDALRELVESDPYYRQMEEDAFRVAACYAGADGLLRMKEHNRNGGKIDMGSAIKEMIEEGKAQGWKAGIEEGHKKGLRMGRKSGKKVGRKIGKKIGREEEKARIVRNMLNRNMPEHMICDIAGCTKKFVQKVRQAMHQDKGM